MGWSKEVEELARRRARALELGGAERVARQHAENRLTVREATRRYELGPKSRTGVRP